MPENDRTPVPAPEKQNELSHTARLLGLIYLPVHIFLLPLLLSVWSDLSPNAVGDLTLNVAYYGVGAVFCLVVLWRWLRGEFDALLDRPLRCLLGVVQGYLVNLLLSYGAMFLMQVVFSLVEDPATGELSGIAAANYRRLFGVAVFLSPLVEETLFCGVLFGSLRKKSRAGAYIVTVAAFALYNVWQYAAAYADTSYLIYALQYIPTALAMVWCYERTRTVWAPIFLHMLINALSLSVLMM